MFWIKPAAACGDQLFCFTRSPGVRLVLVKRRHIAQHRLDHAPLRFNRVFTRKERLIAAQGISEQAFVGSHFISAVMRRNQFHIFANHFLARQLDAQTECNHDLRTEPQAQMIREVGRDFAESLVRMSPLIHRSCQHDLFDDPSHRCAPQPPLALEHLHVHERARAMANAAVAASPPMSAVCNALRNGRAPVNRPRNRQSI